jgi:hypothetical protein
MTIQEADIHIGDGVIVVRRKGASAPAVANILGSITREGNVHLYLDRLVHKHFENEIGGYKVTGAISSILIVPEVSPGPTAHA